MRKSLRWLVVALLLLPSMAGAEATPEARQWLLKMAEIYDKAPFAADLEMEIGTMGGMPMAGTATGRLIQQDRTHMRMEMAMELGGGEGQPGMQMRMLSVNDGTTQWTEMDMGMGKQVIKLDLADVEKMAQQNPPGAGMGAGGMDLVAQVEKMAEIMDFELVGVSGGEVTLRAQLTEESGQAFGAQMPGLETVTIVLDEKLAFPTLVTVGGEQPAITMRIKNLEFVRQSDLPADTFEYTPPEGVPVMDAAAMAPMQGGGR